MKARALHSALLNEPTLMDGDMSMQLAEEQMPQGSCPEKWLLDHPQLLQELAAQYVKAGSRIICTPTATADRSHLETFGLAQESSKINEELTRLTVEACKAVDDDVLVAGCLSPLTLHAQPFGETPFLDIVNIYAEQAFALKRGGADLLLADKMVSLSHCRAAILGCKQTGLPVMVVMDVEADGETNLGCDLVAALIVCQSLGAEAFGLTCKNGSLDHLIRHVEEMIPYGVIPLVVKPDALQSSSQQWAQSMLSLWNSGAVILGGGQGVTPEHIEALVRSMEQIEGKHRAVPLDTDSIFMAGETEPYFLDEFFQQSEPIYCSFDMADELLKAEEDECDVITIQIDTVEDAYNFAENAYMLHKPVSFLSDSEEALEMALLMYNGRAFVDSRSNIDETVLHTIAKGYGAIIR